jgi:DNA end-binding protein Ku
MAAKRTGRKGPRANWTGQLRLDLVTFTVDAVNMIEPGEGDVHFHQLHATCHRRIQHVKECPVHGKVSNDEIVSGYEYKKGKYIEIDPDELDELRTKSEKALVIDTFIDADDMQPVHYDGRHYYLIPKGSQSTEPYVVLCATMAKLGRVAIGQVAFAGREHLVAVRARDDLMVMSTLHRDAEFRSTAGLAVPRIKASRQMMKVAETLIDAATEDDFDYADYKDQYEEKLRELVQAKLKGHEAAAPREEEAEPEVVNLMDALRKSIKQNQDEHRPKRKAARRGGQARRRKRAS